MINKDVKELELLRKMFLHAYGMDNGVYFICGEGGNKDAHGLPDTIHVCPFFGADLRATVIYKKATNTENI